MRVDNLVLSVGTGLYEGRVVLHDTDGNRLGSIAVWALEQAADMTDMAIHESWVYYKRKYPQHLYR